MKDAFFDLILKGTSNEPGLESTVTFEKARDQERSARQICRPDYQTGNVPPMPC
jgi:hypothetical protein